MADSVSRVPRVVASVRPGAPDVFDAWRWSLSPVFDFDVIDSKERNNYAAEVEAYSFTTMNIGCTRGSASAFTRNGSVLARGVEGVLVQLFGAPRYRIEVDGEECGVQPGDIAIFDLTRPLNIRGSAMNELSVMLERSALEAVMGSLERRPVHLLPRGTPLNLILANHMKTLFTQAGSLSTADAYRISSATAGLIGACLDKRDAPPSQAHPHLRGGVRQLILQAIEANLANRDLDAAFLTRTFRISRASLYRMFEADGGLMRYIQKRRLRRACRAITDPSFPDRSIQEIAASVGFTNASHFGRLFRSTFGQAPTDARVSGVTSRPIRADSSEFDLIRSWTELKA